MKKIIWSILFIALFSVPHASAQEIDVQSDAGVSFYGTYTPPKEGGDTQTQGGEHGTGTQSTSPHQALPKTGENDSFSLPLGLSFLGLAWILRNKRSSYVKEEL